MRMTFKAKAGAFAHHLLVPVAHAISSFTAQRRSEKAKRQR